MTGVIVMDSNESWDEDSNVILVSEEVLVIRVDSEHDSRKDSDQDFNRSLHGQRKHHQRR